MMTPGDHVTLQIEKAVAGGRMLARHSGAVVLVSGAIPGETVEAMVEKVQRGTVWASTTSVLEPSPDRVDPFCEPACGGSVYAHVRYARQLDLKRDVLRDAFARLARFPLEGDIPLAASPAEGYRMRARLHARNGRIGFFREGTHELCDAATTRQLLPATCDTLRQLQDALASAGRANVSEIEIAENCAATERAVHIELGAGGDPSQLGPITKIAGLNGVSCGGAQQGRPLTLWGTPVVSDVVSGVTLKRQACAFFQGNRFLLADLVSDVVAAVTTGSVLDLYAGVGLFSAVLAARDTGEVTAIEGDRAAAEDLKRNVAPYRDVSARHQSVEAFLSSRGGRQRVQTVLVDPPRSGMTKDALLGVIRLAPARIVYVSCDVATLARDTRTLRDCNYGLTSLKAFDLFPNTAHVESLAILDRVK
jgi:23S rRNA (uracil1939-C5)-methyltransferase